MDILTLELFDVTVSGALREISRAVDDHPELPLRILLGGDEMLHHNILRFLERHGRAPRLRTEGGHWRIDAAGLPSGQPGSGHPGFARPVAAIPWAGLPESATPYPGSGLPGSGHPGSGLPGSGHPGSGLPGSGLPGSGHPASPPLPAPAPAAPPPPPARLPILLTRSALGQGGAGRRGLLGILRELDPGVPWLCLALDAVELLEDPQAVRLLEDLRKRGIEVRVSRESQLFPTGDGAFELMEDSQWQRLAGRGEIIVL